MPISKNESLRFQVGNLVTARHFNNTNLLIPAWVFYPKDTHSSHEVILFPKLEFNRNAKLPQAFIACKLPLFLRSRVGVDEIHLREIFHRKQSKLLFVTVFRFSLFNLQSSPLEMSFSFDQWKETINKQTP